MSGGLDTVGIRAPNHPVALALIRAVGEPLAAPSANAHTHVSPTTAEHVVRSLGERVDLVLDAGPCAFGIESTVVALTPDPPRVLRPGAISLEQLRAIDPAHHLRGREHRRRRRARGAGNGSEALRPAHERRAGGAGRGGVAEALAGKGRALARVAAIVVTDGARRAAAGCAPLVVLRMPDRYARALFAALRSVDEAASIPS